MPKPKIALIYDFDKTLCTDDMQAYSFIKNLGMESNEFWGEAAIHASDTRPPGVTFPSEYEV